MNVPQLRFKEFDGEWVANEIKNITSYVDYRGKTPQKTDSGIFLVTAKNIRMGYIDYDSSEEYVSQDDYENVMRRGKPNIGDVVITTEAPVGYVANIDRENIALAQRVIKLRGYKGILDNYFLKHRLMSDSFQRDLLKKATGGTVKGIKGSIFHKMLLIYPSLPEQTKIANFLTAIDERINQLTRKKELMTQYKQGVMQQIFSQQLRFKNDNGEDFADWEENTIQYFIDNKSILGHLDGNHGALYPKSDDFSKTGVPYISANDFVDGSVDFKNCKFLSNDKAALFKKGIAKDGDVLFAHNATVGPCAILQTDFDYVVLSTTATYYRCNLSKINNVFLLYFFQSDFFVSQYTGIMSQSTRNQVPITTQRKLLLALPSLSEQTKIANFLTTLDEKIQQISQQIEATKQYKQGLLQQMFV